MQKVNIGYWEDGGGWIGYLQEYPDYWTQGDTLEDLKEHLRDLYKDLNSGEIPGIRKVEELLVELAEFRGWFAEYDAEAWDRQFEADVKAGKLDALAERALRARASNRSKGLG